MGRIGVAISGGPNPAEIVDLVVLAETLGYESAWLAEGHGGDQFAILAACAVRTSRIRLGTSISSVFVRSAPKIAMAASTVADLSGGRFILGLGSSHKAQVGPEHGATYARPLTRTRETVAIVRELLRSGRVHSPHQHHLQTQVFRPLCVLALVEAEVFERLLERLIFVPHAHPGRAAIFINLDRRDHPSRVLV
jgi:alkanesulfonate monooxygenase SsuD/methylene tetrahydromethanopterin reductase-like flavin-dependent oxidoreductase (luciferase family)